MNTYRELIFMCLDQVKVISDDSYFEEEHVSFLLDKYRAFLLKQRYGDIRKDIPQSNYQEICLDVEQVVIPQENICGSNIYLKSTSKVPDIIKIGAPRIYPVNYFNFGQISFIDRNRMMFVGSNKYLQNIIYVSLWPDQHLYFKSANPQFSHLEKVQMTAVFSDSKEAFKLQCLDKDGNTVCDLLDMTFPIEDALIPPLIELTVKELLGASYRPQDTKNNSSDDLSDIANFVRSNMRSDFNKSMM